MAYTLDSVRRFMEKQALTEDMICYILRREGSTCLHLLDGRVPETQIPLGHFEKYLDPEQFLRVNKDVLLAVGQVLSVHSGKYLMTDGAVLEGRHHGTRSHTEFRRRMAEAQADESALLQEIQAKYAAYDDFPFPFCVTQMVFDLHGKETTFIFRYCNKMMAQLEGKSIRQMLDHSYYEVFRNADRKWLVKYGDIVKNGGYRSVREYSPEIGKWLNLVAYRVAPGFCACIVVEDGWMSVLDPTFRPGSAKGIENR